jgi:hypothetical protein
MELFSIQVRRFIQITFWVLILVLSGSEQVIDPRTEFLTDPVLEMNQSLLDNQNPENSENAWGEHYLINKSILMVPFALINLENNEFLLIIHKNQALDVFSPPPEALQT